jgi:hypothetical protein
MRISPVINAASHGRNVSIKERRAGLDTDTEVPRVMKRVSRDSGSVRVQLDPHFAIKVVIDTRAPVNPNHSTHALVADPKKTRVYAIRDVVPG